jgi:predicted helicase
MMPRRRSLRLAAERALRALAQAAAAMLQDEIRESQSYSSSDDAEVAVCLRVARLLHPELSPQAWHWISQQLEPRWQTLLSQSEDEKPLIEAADAVRRSASGEIDPLAGFYEHFLHAYHPTGRKQRGVFYTPLPMVRYIVRAVDRLLRDEFSVPSGLLGEQLNDGTPLRILDPALGAGLFLTEILTQARSQVAADDDWNRRVPSLIARLGGIEILPAAAVIALVRVGATLERTGYRFESDSRIELRIVDALAAPLRPAWPVIVGNPPFSGISEAKHPWLHDLLHGRGPDGVSRASYFDVAGQPLGERKHWLQDDYVKFLRIAHEQIETAGQGIIALVTSHGYLDNITFRGLREKLMQTFPRITLIDLHGNAKRRERTATGQRDENVFGIEQGVAIGIYLMCRTLRSVGIA